jgi:hypothetical protein
MDVLRIAGDALWILALSLMAGASRAAWRQIGRETAVPMLITRGGVLWRTRRAVALTLIPAAAFVTGIALVASNRRATGWGDDAVILFGVRAALAPLFALAHLRWLGAAMAALAREGALKP